MVKNIAMRTESLEDLYAPAGLHPALKRDIEALVNTEQRVLRGLDNDLAPTAVSRAAFGAAVLAVNFNAPPVLATPPAPKMIAASRTSTNQLISHI